MNAECPNLEKCPMFKYFQTDFAKETYVSLFCRGKFVECERKKLKDGCKTVPKHYCPMANIYSAPRAPERWSGLPFRCSTRSPTSAHRVRGRRRANTAKI